MYMLSLWFIEQKKKCYFLVIKNLLITSYTILKRCFQEKLKYSEFVEFRSEKNSDKDERYNLQVDLITNEIFNQNEIEEIVFTLYSINQ
jgi:hypothetical protein